MHQESKDIPEVKRPTERMAIVNFVRTNYEKVWQT